MAKVVEDYLKSIEGNRFVYNDYFERKKVLQTLIERIQNCDEFMFSVAFITEHGLELLKPYLAELEKKGIKGRIITTNYLNFTNPKALEFLMRLKNIKLRMNWQENSNDIGFHTKGYIFRKQDKFNVLIGSSNLTADALTENKEWNVEVSGKEDAVSIKNVLDEFEKMWINAKPIGEVLSIYKKIFEIADKKRRKTQTEIETKEFKPNVMQTVFSSNLLELYENNQNKGLLISATGTGKTFASAFGTELLFKIRF